MIEAAIRAPKQRTGNLDAFIEPLAVMFIIKFLTANRSSRHPFSSPLHLFSTSKDSVDYLWCNIWSERPDKSMFVSVPCSARSIGFICGLFHELFFLAGCPGLVFIRAF